MASKRKEDDRYVHILGKVGRMVVNLIFFLHDHVDEDSDDTDHEGMSVPSPAADPATSTVCGADCCNLEQAVSRHPHQVHNPLILSQTRRMQGNRKSSFLFRVVQSIPMVNFVCHKVKNILLSM